LTAFLADLRKDPIRWRASHFGYIACFCQGSEFSTFAFYLPVLFVSLGVSSILGTNLVTMGLYVIAAISGWVGPLLTPKIGHRGISIWGFGIVFTSLLVAAAAIYTGHQGVLPFVAAAMLWGHYWDASNYPDDGRPAGISRHRQWLRLRLRQSAVLPGYLPVPGPVHRHRPSGRHALRGNLSSDRCADGDIHPAGGVRLRAGL
jgi:hypothetical protein